MFALLAFAGVRAQSDDPTDPSYWDEEKLAAFDAEIAAQYEDVIYMKSSIFPAGSGVVELPINVKSHAPFLNVQFRTVMPNGAYPLDEADELGEMKVIIVPTDRISADALDGKNFTDEGYTQYVSSKMGFCSGDDGVFFSVKLDITGWEAGVYDLVVNSGAILSGFAPDDANGRRQVNAEIKTKLVISDEIVLNEMATTFPLEYDKLYEGVNVRVKRTISANNWNTICLPFDMSAEQCKEVFGDDVKFADFTGYEYDEDNQIIHVNFNQDVTSITANRPCLIKISKENFTEFSLKNIDINASEDLTIAAVKRVEKGKNKQWSEMTGTYVNNTALYDVEGEWPYVFLSGNKFYCATEQTKPMKGFRAFFDFYDTDVAYEPTSGVKFSYFVDDEPTSIDGISTIEKVADGVYNVSGQKVSESSLEGLPKGVYIVNGKKVFKK